MAETTANEIQNELTTTSNTNVFDFLISDYILNIK
jgi:hypothetical protein